MTKATKYLSYIIPTSLFGIGRTKEILTINPVTDVARKEAEHVYISVYDYNEIQLAECTLQQIEESFSFKENSHISWINIDGLRKSDVESISNKFGIHPLIAEDILSIGQRPKMD